MQIVIDTREPDHVVDAFIALQTELEKKNEVFTISREMLTIGDVVVDGKIVFERKEGVDCEPPQLVKIKRGDDES